MSHRPVTITVTGHAEREFMPNRCTVVLQVHADGSTRKRAAEPVTTAVTAVTDLVTELRERTSSPVKRWTFDQVRHTRSRPYDHEGKTRPWVYSSSASITVTFGDFREVAGFVEQVSALDVVTVADLRWWITRKAQHKRLTRVRDLAVRDALGKAKGYTNSLGYSTFHVTALADPGMLGVQSSSGPPAGGPMMRAVAMRADAAATSHEGGLAVVLEPDRITLSADVEARFEAL